MTQRRTKMQRDKHEKSNKTPQTLRHFSGSLQRELMAHYMRQIVNWSTQLQETIMSTENPYERQLADSISESIMFMTGRVPNRRCAYCAVIGGVIGYSAGIASLAGILWFVGRAMQ